MVEAAANGRKAHLGGRADRGQGPAGCTTSGSRGGGKRSSPWPLWCHTSPGPVRRCGRFAPRPVIVGLRRHRALLRLVRGALARSRRAASGTESSARVLLTARRRFPGAGDPHPGSGEPTASSADLMRECADGACTPAPGGRWCRPGPQQGPGRSDPRPARKQRYAVYQTAGDLNSPPPPESMQHGEDDQGFLHANGRGRAEARARTLFRPCGATFPQGSPEEHGRGNELPVPDPAEYGMEPWRRRLSPARPPIWTQP